MNSPGHKLPSKMVLHCILPSYSIYCHPSSSLTCMRSLSIQRWEGERLDAMAAREVLDLEDGRELERGRGRQRA
jgi:hypothetical protein